MAEIRLVIVDDHEMVREGLVLLLEEAGDLVVVGQAASAKAAVATILEHQPDVVLLDMVLPDGDGIGVLRQLREAGSTAHVVILTSFAEEARVQEALRAGAVGYLLKDVLRHDLLSAIRAAAEGRTTLHPVVQTLLVRQVTRPAVRSPLETLTERETEVLRQLAHGKSNKEIAATLGLTLGTVKGYVSLVLSKLDVADRTQATLLAVRHGLVNPHQS